MLQLSVFHIEKSSSNQTIAAFKHDLILSPFSEILNNITLHLQQTNYKTSIGGPPLTRKSLTRFPLTRFLAYVRVSGGISVSRGLQYSPTNTSFM